MQMRPLSLYLQSKSEAEGKQDTADRAIFEFESVKAYDHLQIELGIDQNQMQLAYEKHDFLGDKAFNETM